MSIPNIPQNFPPPEQAIIDNAGRMTHALQFFLLALFNRTGGQNGTPSIDSYVPDPPNLVMLATDINILEPHVSPFAQQVQLFNMQPGQSQWVFNVSAINVDIFPPTGGTIDGGGVTPYTLNGGKVQVFTCMLTPGDIRSLQLG